MRETLLSVLVLFFFHSFAAAYSQSDLPSQLSALGLFSDLSQMQPRPEVIQYDVLSPLWSDGAEKKRWLYLPPNQKIQLDANQNMIYPQGTILVKHFQFDRKVETRISYLSQSGWQYGAYVWNADQTNAELTEAEVESQVSSSASNHQLFSWAIPSRKDCVTCHSSSLKSPVLGLSLEQLGSAQIENWVQKSLLSNLSLDLSKINYLPDLNIKVIPTDVNAPDYKITIERMARGYLAVNCASCHQPGGFVPTNLDFRWGISNQEMNAINEFPNFGDNGIVDAKIISPGLKKQSLVWTRMNSYEFNHMPYMGSKIIDQFGLDLVGAWVETLANKP